MAETGESWQTAARKIRARNQLPMVVSKHMPGNYALVVPGDGRISTKDLENGETNIIRIQGKEGNEEND